MNKNKSLLYSGLIGGLAFLILTILNYVAHQVAGLPRTSFLLFDWLARILPGGLLTFAIDTIVAIITSLNLGPTSTVAALAEQGIAVLLFSLLGVVFGVLLHILGKNREARLVDYGLMGGVLFSILMVAILVSLPPPAAGINLSILWIILTLVLWGTILGRLIQIILIPEDMEKPGGLSRRQFLQLIGIGSFTILVSAIGARFLPRNQNEEIVDTGESPEAETMVNASTTSGPAQSPPQEALGARQPPVDGVRSELTSNQDFYRIDINSIPPTIDASNWRLEIGGLVRNPLSLSLEELASRPSISQAITLECISNRLGGDLIGTSLWTGVQLKQILEEAGLQPEAQEVYIESVDGFYESVPMSDAMDERTLLVYEMNGQPLPPEHGYPLRIYIPNRFGMKQPKWITRMEVINQEGPGYWVERGWSEEAIPPTTSVIDIVSVDHSDPETGQIPVGGIAYAGARGISKVEIQVDDGPWEEAELRLPALSPLTWVQWRYDWRPFPGRHVVQVRAYDGSGELQETDPSPPHPDGATGIYQTSVNTPVENNE